MAKRTILLISLCVWITVAAPPLGNTYILPSVQILQFMTKKYAAIKTLQVTQLTKIMDLRHEREKVFGETLSLVAPDLYRSEAAAQPGIRLVIHNGPRTLRIVNEEVVYDMQGNGLPFHFLMVARDPNKLMEILRTLGINLDRVSLTRYDGRIAFMIGGEVEGSPRLLIDKDAFLPLLLKYGNVLFRASDFRELTKESWYPYHIIYEYAGPTIEDYLLEEYMAKDAIPNPPLDESLFDIPLVRSQFEKPRYAPNIPLTNDNRY
jgi:hypothetical protein